MEKESIWTNRGRKINMRDYLFGIENEVGINHFWIEGKLFIFYNWKVEDSIESNKNRIISKLRRIIILEKQIIKG